MPTFPRLPRAARRFWLTVHVAVSVGWLGVSLVLLTLGLTGRFFGDARTAPAGYLIMRLLADWLLVPVSLLSLLTGTLLAVGTRWGLLRHRWVATKFWLALAGTLAALVALRHFIGDAAAQVAAGAARPSEHDQIVLVIAPSAQLVLYLFVTTLSVLKPWGLTTRGRRLRAQARSAT